jgi:hypothetical protein
VYQRRLDERHVTREGIVSYRRPVREEPGASLGDTYGNLADGTFHTGIYLASQALRAAAGEEEARDDVERGLGALRLLMEVTGKRGLLARHLSPAGSERRFDDPRWLPSATRPAYAWRSDVSKDQYAGFAHGVGVAVALAHDPVLRLEAGRLAAAAADHLVENDMRIVDVDGAPTTFGDLRPRFLCFPKGVDALITLALVKAAACGTGERKYADLYSALIAQGYAETAYWAHFTVFGVGNRVNDNMAYLALYPLLLLETDAGIRAALRSAEERWWRDLRDDRNAFFAFIHAVAASGPNGASGPDDTSREDAAARGRAALHEFPDDKIEWPVDLTREGFDLPRAFLNTRACMPRSIQSIPLYLRVRSSSMWAGDPFRLAGRLESQGTTETAGGDYLVAYWLGRYHGFIGDEFIGEEE